MKKNKIFIFVFLSFIFFSRYAISQITLSEIMYDPDESEYYHEFIEIYNLSTGNSIDLTGWKIGDGSGFDQIIAVDQGIVIAPNQYAIILDPGYFDHERIYDNLIPPEALILTIDDGTFGNSGLSNSTAETVSLINATGDTVSVYTYSLGNTAGYSDEKIDLAGENTNDNWADAETLSGTPGAVNSVTPIEYDVAVSLFFEPETPAANSTITIYGSIKNIGLKPAAELAITFYEDSDGNSIPTADEKIAPAINISETILAGDSLIVTTDWHQVSSGAYAIIAYVDFALDQDSTNNLAIKTLAVSFQELDMVINEIMYSPLSGHPEWIELYNRSNSTINFQDWGISDSDTNSIINICSTPYYIEPDSFLVIAEDTLSQELFPGQFFSILTTSKFPALNNTSDNIYLYDLNRNIIDVVNYKSSWGGDKVSLERINPNISSTDSSNWSSCVDLPAGGTPGRENSIYIEIIPAATAISVSPDPFSPDSDGHDDYTIINYKLPMKTASINIKIYDIRGRLVRYLCNNKPSGAEGHVIWNGENDDKNICRIGIYIIYLEALNAFNGVIVSHKKTVVLAANL